MRATPPTMVNSAPLPIALINGEVTMQPIQLKMLRTKLFSATPLLAFRGINSVSIVVAIANINIDLVNVSLMLYSKNFDQAYPMPKKKLATIGPAIFVRKSAVHP